MVRIEDGVTLGPSTVRLLQRLDKSNQVVVMINHTGRGKPSVGISERKTPREIDSPRARSNVIQSSEQDLEREKAGSNVRALRIVTRPPGDLVRSWTKTDTLAVKERLKQVDRNRSDVNVVRSGDLGIKTTKGIMPLGVVISLASHTTSLRSTTAAGGVIVVVPRSIKESYPDPIREAVKLLKPSHICVYERGKAIDLKLLR